MRDYHSRETDISIVYMRCFSILCIVLHHSIAAFQGWPPSTQLYSVIPKLVGEMSYVFRDMGLAAFTFIAGYCVVGSLSKNSLKQFILNKIQRLLLPASFWGLVYLTLFPTMMHRASPVNGTHLWYLPMIFVCFAYCAVFVKIFRQWHVIMCGWGYILMLVAFKLLWRTNLCDYFGGGGLLRPFQTFIFFFPIFIAGMACSLKINRWSAFLGLGIIIFGQYLIDRSPLANKDLLYSIVLFSIFRFIRESGRYFDVIRSLDRCSFGIYLIHQFLLNVTIIVLSNYHLGWRIELPVLFLMAFPVSWFVVFAWQRLAKSQT